jgi:membrane-bound metal-dependent hydrolase YbcI (DUF457 family)
MMRVTHRAFCGAFIVGGTLLVDALASRAGHGIPINLGTVLGLAITATPFSAGKSSPDIDHLWAPGPPRQNYDWKFHRGWTHRFWFANTLLLITGILPYVFLTLHGVPSAFAQVVFGPSLGWTSHLFGDMIYGRILVMGQPIGLGWKTGGASESGDSSWVVDPAAKVFTGLTAGLAALHLLLLVQVYA